MGGNIVFRLGAVAAFACVSVLCGLAGSVVVVAVAGNDNDNGGGGPRAATADVVAAAPTMQLVMLRDGESRGTVCNDGTVAGYYIRLSVSVPASSNWLVHLEGGHWCWDDQTCMDRNSSSPYLMSNKYWTETLDKNSGVFSLDSTENPSFWDANQVYVNYCSSDAHTGDRGVTSPSSPWYFRGKRIVAGVFQDLSETTEFSKATSVVFSGCSAGARGVLANVDLVANLVSQYAPQATFRAFSDAGWWYDRDPLYPTIVSLREQTQLGVAYFNGTADQDCMSTMSESDKWQCFFAMYAWPYISTPIFWQVEQYDSWQLGWNGVSIPLDTLREKDYVYSFAHYVKSTTRDIANNMPQDGVFSPGCWDHCMSESDQYYRVHVTNPITAELATLKDTLHWWLGNEPPSFIDVVESCLDFNCSVNCLAS